MKEHLSGAQVRFPSSVQDSLREKGFECSIDRGEACILADNVNETIQRLIGSNIDLGEMRVVQPNLDDLFIKLTGRELRDS